MEHRTDTITLNKLTTEIQKIKQRTQICMKEQVIRRNDVEQ